MSHTTLLVLVCTQLTQRPFHGQTPQTRTPKSLPGETEVRSHLENTPEFSRSLVVWMELQPYPLILSYINDESRHGQANDTHDSSPSQERIIGFCQVVT